MAKTLAEQARAGGEEADFERQKTEAKSRELTRAEAIKKVLANKECRAWFAEILSFADIDGNPHVPNSFDSTAFNCGMANLGRMIWKQIKDAAPDLAILMIEEAHEPKND